MKIAIMSDIHDNFHNLVIVLKKIKEDDEIKQVLFLGDFGNNGIAKILADFELPVIAVWGNNDGDKSSLTKTSLKGGSKMDIADNIYRSIEIEGRKVFMSHYPDIAKSMAKSGDYDAVFYGHNHVKNLDKVGNCLVVNPGEISAHKTGFVSFAVYDTDKNEADFVEVKDVICVHSKEVEEYLKDSEFRLSKSSGHQY